MGDWYERPDGTWTYDDQAPIVDPTPTGLVPVVKPSPVSRVEVEVDESEAPEQDDLSYLDDDAGELVNTDKLNALDLVLIQPPQDPEWRSEQ